MKAVVIIPARYDSTRLPGKPLLCQTGKPLIQHVYEQAEKARLSEKTVVATDDERILQAVEAFSGCAAMTSKEHRSGTDRIAAVAKNLDADIVVNLQGDEPEIDPEAIDQVIALLRDDDAASMSTLAVPSESPENICDPHVVKVVVDSAGYALYFSRAVIPHGKDVDSTVRNPRAPYLLHLGLYAYRRDFLLGYSSLKSSCLEQAEELEQLRALENGYRIKVGIAEHQSLGIDTMEEYERFVKRCVAVSN